MPPLVSGAWGRGRSGGGAGRAGRGGRLNGMVVDESGAPVEGVSISTKTALGLAIDAKTDAKGNWVVPGLGKGLWEVDFAKDGFTKVKAKVTIDKELMRTEPIKITLKKG